MLQWQLFGVMKAAVSGFFCVNGVIQKNNTKICVFDLFFY